MTYSEDAKQLSVSIARNLLEQGRLNDEIDTIHKDCKCANGELSELKRTKPKNPPLEISTNKFIPPDVSRKIGDNRTTWTDKFRNDYQLVKMIETEKDEKQVLDDLLVEYNSEIILRQLNINVLSDRRQNMVNELYDMMNKEQEVKTNE